MKKCKICGQPQKDDLFSYVTQEEVCSVCKINFIGGMPTTPENINSARDMLGLAEDEYLVQDNSTEARKILGR